MLYHPDIGYTQRISTSCNEAKEDIITGDGDRINYVVYYNYGTNENVYFRFRLGEGIIWEKQLALIDLNNFSISPPFMPFTVIWNLLVKGENDKAENIVSIGQIDDKHVLHFFKIKGFFQGHILQHVFTFYLSNLNPIPPGSLVEFTWVKD